MACGGRLRAARLEGRRRRRCPRCGWIFYDNPVPAAVAVVLGPRGILLARRARPPYAETWDLPGGFLEAGELPDRALRRELQEELGVRARIVRFLGSFTERYGPRGFPILAMVYLARLDGPPAARSDVSEIRWFSPRAVPWREIAFPSVKRALRAYLARVSRERRPRSPARSGRA